MDYTAAIDAVTRTRTPLTRTYPTRPRHRAPSLLTRLKAWWVR